MGGKVDVSSRYDDEPVYYCRRCLSLNIQTRPGLGDYCAKCGGASVGVTDIASHEKMMADRIKALKGDNKLKDI